MNIGPSHPFNTQAVLWYQCWRNMIRSAKQGGPNQNFYEHQAVRAQAQYVCALAAGGQ